jgi:hypothetical protein
MPHGSVSQHQSRRVPAGEGGRAGSAGFGQTRASFHRASVAKRLSPGRLLRQQAFAMQQMTAPLSRHAPTPSAARSRSYAPSVTPGRQARSRLLHVLLPGDVIGMAGAFGRPATRLMVRALDRVAEQRIIQFVASHGILERAHVPGSLSPVARSLPVARVGATCPKFSVSA